MRRLLPFLLAAAFLVAPAGAAATPHSIVVRAAGGAPIRVLLRVEGKRRVVGRAHGPGTKQRRKVTVHLRIPAQLPNGRWPLIVCVASHCRRASWVAIRNGPHPNGATAGHPSPPVTTPAPISTVPTAPISHPVGEPFKVASGGVEYWAYVPHSYDPSNLTPATLFVWLHGCFGEAEGDAWVVDPEASEEGTQDWLTLSLAGREGGAEGECWVPRVDEARVLAALADFETHFNVNRQRVVLGGYSSGGDLAYRTGFFHSQTFAELLIENSAPFRDTEASQAELLGAATTKFHIVHLAHIEDENYVLAQTKSELAAVTAAGFPVEVIERPGHHSDSHTDSDLRKYLLPHIDDGWLAPPP